MNDSRIALCHEWLTTLGGSDLTAARIARVLDVDDVFTFTLERTLAEALFPGREVRLAHEWGGKKVVRNHWPWFLPLMPLAWKQLDLSSYDLVVTSSHACTNAIRTPPGTTHLSYCYTPMRYAWEWSSEVGRLPWPMRPFWRPVAAALRVADRSWAKEVDGFIAISEHVADRIRRYYSRDAVVVVYPPVETSFWTPAAVEREDFFLIAGRFVAYKRAEVAIEAMSRLGLPLVVAGSGPELARLRHIAGSNVRFVVQPSGEELRDLYRATRALLFPGVEDFGLTLVEAQACGTPVIAFGEGGARETVINGATGVLYEEPTIDDLIEGVRNFEQMSFDTETLRANAERFASEIFDTNFGKAVESFLVA